jgi:pilus assembly protein CpaB
VTPEDAETLSLASNQTKIQLVLRNPLDTAINKIQGTDQANLFADQMAPVKPAHAVVKKVAATKPPPAFSIEVINGNKRSEAKFGTPGGTQ